MDQYFYKLKKKMLLQCQLAMSVSRRYNAFRFSSQTVNSSQTGTSLWTTPRAALIPSADAGGGLLKFQS